VFCSWCTPEKWGQFRSLFLVYNFPVTGVYWTKHRVFMNRLRPVSHELQNLTEVVRKSTWNLCRNWKKQNWRMNVFLSLHLHNIFFQVRFTEASFCFNSPRTIRPQHNIPHLSYRSIKIENNLKNPIFTHYTSTWPPRHSILECVYNHAVNILP
jgi:hypothetical protein